MSDRHAAIALAVTGASGAPYAVRLLQQLVRAERRVWLIVSVQGWRLLEAEAGVGSSDELRQRVGAGGWSRFVTSFDDGDFAAPPASGSSPSAGMVICPCSMGVLSAVSQGATHSLVERAADVALKERRKLILVPRETPLSAIHLENMLRVTRAGAVVLPAAPGFYGEPTDIDDLVDFIVARILDHLDVEHDLARPWSRSSEDDDE